MQYGSIGNYPLFINLLTTFAYLPTSLAYVIPMAIYRPDVITPEARAIPQKTWIIQGALDSLAGVMQSLAVAKITSGGLIVLLLQSAIPVSMALSIVFLKTKYLVSQYVGAAIVIAGLAAALVPSLVRGDSGGDSTSTAIWAAVLIASCVPMVLSSIYKEKSLGDTGEQWARGVGCERGACWCARGHVATAPSLMAPAAHHASPTTPSATVQSSTRSS